MRGDAVVEMAVGGEGRIAWPLAALSGLLFVFGGFGFKVDGWVFGELEEEEGWGLRWPFCVAWMEEVELELGGVGEEGDAPDEGGAT
jgi:hypothetical protein